MAAPRGRDRPDAGGGGAPTADGAQRCTLGTVAENAAVTAFYLALGYRATETREVPQRGFTAYTWEKRLDVPM